RGGDVPGGCRLDVHAAPAGRRRAGGGVGVSTSAGPTVLVVEDEESFVDALLVGLQREGFTVTVARDGAEALALFDVVRPDLVLLDLMLPRLSGVDVCRQLRG